MCKLGGSLLMCSRHRKHTVRSGCLASRLKVSKHGTEVSMQWGWHHNLLDMEKIVSVKFLDHKVRTGSLATHDYSSWSLM